MIVWPEPPPASHQDIVKEAHRIFLEYVKVCGSEYILTHGISFQDVYEQVLYPKTEVVLDTTSYLGRDENGELILGQFDPYKNIVYINKQLIDDNDPRLIFTSYHETGGHAVLHGPYLRKQKCNHPPLNTTASSIMNEIMQPLERQANTFASNLAAPIPFIRLLCKLHFGLTFERSFSYIEPCMYCLNFMGSNERIRIYSKNHLAREIAKKLKRFFGGLSTEALSYQVEQAVIDDLSHQGISKQDTSRLQTIGECLQFIN